MHNVSFKRILKKKKEEEENNMIESSVTRLSKIHPSRHQQTIKYFQSSKPRALRNNGWSDEWIAEIIKGVGIEKLEVYFRSFTSLSLAARVRNV